MNITVEAWDKSDKANQAILSLVCDAFPLAFVPKPDESLQFLTDLTTGLEDSFFVAKENHQLVGFALLSRSRFRDSVYVGLRIPPLSSSGYREAPVTRTDADHSNSSVNTEIDHIDLRI